MFSSHPRGWWRPDFLKNNENAGESFWSLFKLGLFLFLILFVFFLPLPNACPVRDTSPSSHIHGKIYHRVCSWPSFSLICLHVILRQEEQGQKDQSSFSVSDQGVGQTPNQAHLHQENSGKRFPSTTSRLPPRGVCWPLWHGCYSTRGSGPT